MTKHDAEYIVRVARIVLKYLYSDMTLEDLNFEYSIKAETIHKSIDDPEIKEYIFTHYIDRRLGEEFYQELVRRKHDRAEEKKRRHV